MDLAVECYELTRQFPKDEVYGLVSQIRRAASSLPANVAEGYGRDAMGAYIQHLKMAQGSLKELETHLLLSERLSMLPSIRMNGILGHTEEVGKMLRSLIRSLQDKRDERTT